MRWRSVTRASGLRLSGVWPFRRGCGVGLPAYKGGQSPPLEFGVFPALPKTAERTVPHPVRRASSLPNRAPARLFESSEGASFSGFASGPPPIQPHPKRSVGAGCGVGLRPTKAGRARLWSLAIFLCSRNRQARGPPYRNASVPPSRKADLQPAKSSASSTFESSAKNVEARCVRTLAWCRPTKFARVPPITRSRFRPRAKIEQGAGCYSSPWRFSSEASRAAVATPLLRKCMRERLWRGPAVR